MYHRKEKAILDRLTAILAGEDAKKRMLICAESLLADLAYHQRKAEESVREFYRVREILLDQMKKKGVRNQLPKERK